MQQTWYIAKKGIIWRLEYTKGNVDINLSSVLS
jgi:hypothetical protein